MPGAKISDAGAFSPLRKTPVERALTGWNMDYSPAYHWLDLMSRMLSPYMFNPLNINPVRDVLQELLDLDAVHACGVIKLFVTATHVASGQARVFGCDEISIDTLLASSCMPFLFQAVEIEGEHYWDGGYMGNPAIWPLIYNCCSEDVALVQINPIHNDQLPQNAHDIINRLNEITFNSSLIAEMRAIDFVSRLRQENRLDRKRYKDMHMHLIYAADQMHQLTASSKVNADWDFFIFLKNIGRQTAEAWLKAHWQDIGVRSSVNIREKFLSAGKKAAKKPALKKRADKHK